MKKKLLPITLLAMLGLVACGPTTSSSEVVPPTSDTPTSESTPSVEEGVTTLAIANKADLQAEWHAEEADREIVLDTDKPINIGAEIGAGNLTVTSSDTAVVLANGKFLSAVGAGTATITVTYKEKLTDTVEITVLEALGAPAMKKATIAEIMAGEDNTGNYQYFVDGKVTKFGKEPNPDKYGNLYLVDPDAAEGADAFQIYGSSADATAMAYDMGKKQFVFTNPKNNLDNDFTKDIKVGDVVSTVTIRSDYGKTVEGMSIIRGINGQIIPNYVHTVEEIMGMKEIQKNFAVQVTGKIASLDGSDKDGSKYGNVTLQSLTSDTTMTVYGLTSSLNQIKVDAEAGNLYFKNPQDFLTNEKTNVLKAGDIITITGVLGAHNGKNQISGYLMPASLNFPDKDVKIRIGETAEFVATPKFTTGEVTYEIADTTVAVLEEGKIKALKAGKTTITATCNGLTATATIDAYEPKAEPQVLAKTLEEIMAPEGSTARATQAYKTTVKVAAFTDKGKVVDAATKYGNMNVTDVNGANETVVYGASGNKGSVAWSDYYGNYSFRNGKDFDTNDATKNIKVGDTLEVIAIRSDFKKNNDTPIAKQLNIEITKVVTGEGGETNPDTPTAGYTTIADTGVIPTIENHALVNSLDFDKSKAFQATGKYGAFADNDEFKSYIDAATGETASNITAATQVKGYVGNNNESGPAFSQKSTSCLKLGSSSAAGELHLTLADGKTVTRVAVLGAGWKSTDKISVNGSTAVEFVAETTGEHPLTWMVFEVASTNIVDIVISNRGCLAKIALYA